MDNPFQRALVKANGPRLFPLMDQARLFHEAVPGVAIVVLTVADSARGE